MYWLDAYLNEVQLASHLLPRNAAPQRGSQYVLPNFALIHQELKDKCMTLQLLWHEYVASTEGKTYSYSAFCEHYSRFTKTLKLSMKQIHKAGEKCFVDYAGPTIPIIDVLTGEITRAQIFVAVLGASSYTFALATRAQAGFQESQGRVAALVAALTRAKAQLLGKKPQFSEEIASYPSLMQAQMAL